MPYLSEQISFSTLYFFAQARSARSVALELSPPLMHLLLNAKGFAPVQHIPKHLFCLLYVTITGTKKPQQRLCLLMPGLFPAGRMLLKVLNHGVKLAQSAELVLLDSLCHYGPLKLMLRGVGPDVRDLSPGG